MIRRARTRLTTLLTGWYGRLLTFDPALSQLRRAARAGIAAAAGYGGGHVLATTTHSSNKIALLAGIVAMLVAINIRDTDLRGRLTTTAYAAIALPVGVCVGTLLTPYRFAGDIAFVAVMFVATWLRQFGTRWQALGTLAFMGYFFTLFLRLGVGELPWLVLAAVIGVAATAVVRFTVLRDRPVLGLRRALRSLEGRAARVMDASAALLVIAGRQDGEKRQRARDDLAEATRALDQVALQVEQQIDDPAAAPGVPDPAGLRQASFELQVATERLAAATAAVAEGSLDAATRAELHVSYLAVHAGGESGTTAEPLRAGETSVHHNPADHLRGRLANVEASLAALRNEAARVQRNAAPQLPNVFAGMVELPRFERIRAAIRWDTPMRTAVQVTAAGALAIVAGELISPSRWYWAVLTAYFVFFNAHGQAGTLRRALQRVVGTALGVVAGLLVGYALAGDQRVELILLLVGIVTAYWATLVSYGLMIFFITIDLALLYSVLGTFEGIVLWLRLAETIAGAVIGGAVALLVVPSSERGTADTAIAALFGKIGDALDAVAAAARRSRKADDATHTLPARLRDIDEAFMKMRDAYRPIHVGVPRLALEPARVRVATTTVSILGPSPAAHRAETEQLAACRYWTRILAVDVDLVSSREGTGDTGLAQLPTSGLLRVQDNVRALERRLRGEDAGALAAPRRGPGGKGPSEAADDAGSPAVRALRKLDDAVTGYARTREWAL